MEELRYPFDAAALLKNRRSIRRELLADGTKRIPKKIAVLGGSTTDNVVKMLELFLLKEGIEPSFWECEYNRWWQDAVFGNPELEEFAPDLIYIHTTWRNLGVSGISLKAEQTEVDKLVDDEYGRFLQAWEKLSETYHCPVIQNNFEMPFWRLLGNRDGTDIHGNVYLVNRLNEKFAAYARENKNFYIHDLNYVAASYGLDKWYDLSYWYLYKYAMTLEAIPSVSFSLSRIIKSIYGKNKKVLSLDLDNTLWGGVIGDDGVEGIEIGHETAMSECYEEFQQYVKAQKQLGILLTVASKNDEENAVAGLNHPASALHPDDFITIKANWDPKDKNLIDTVNELSLGADSIVFADDNPAERHIVSSQIPGAAVPEIGTPNDYIRVLDKNGYFEVTTLSEDDLTRGDMYKANKERAQLSAAFTDYNEYLRSLEMKADIAPFPPVYMERIAQLTNKSNQFNVTTKRYTVAQIEEMASDENCITLYGRLEDKFGDNGVVSVAAGHIEKKELHLDLWLMSCRVLKRDMELAMLDTLVGACQKKGLETIVGYYYPTAKNGMVKELFKTFGFDKVSESENGDTVWTLSTANYEKQNHVIQVEE